MTHEVLGFRSSGLLDKVRERRVTPPMPDDMSRGCAAELCNFMGDLAQGSLISVSASSQIERWLSADADTSMVASAFNVDPLAHWPADAGVHLCHKTGTEHDVRGDVGFIRRMDTGHTVAYAILANWDAHRYGDLRDVVLRDMSSLGTGIRRVLDANQPQAW
jgi:beta-lactamase class A